MTQFGFSVLRGDQILAFIGGKQGMHERNFEVQSQGTNMGREPSLEAKKGNQFGESRKAF